MIKRTLTKKLQRFFFYLIWKFLPNCKQFVPILSESLDRKIPPYQRILVKLHLIACPPCVRYLKQIRFVREAAQQCGENIWQTETNTKLSDDARERMKNLLKTSAIIISLFESF
jgi:hypothetical protein